MKNIILTSFCIIALLSLSACFDSEKVYPEMSDGVSVSPECEGVEVPNEKSIPLVIASDENLVQYYSILGSDGETVCGKIPYKDINRNGEMDIYEDWRLSADERAEALVSDEIFNKDMKAALMINVNLYGPIWWETVWKIEGNAVDMGIRLFKTQENKVYPIDHVYPADRGDYYNSLQVAAESAQLALPALVSSEMLPAYPNTAKGMTEFPGMPGLGAASYSNLPLAKQMAGDIAADLSAVGVRLVFGPQADLATELRWKEAENLLGEDPDMVADQIYEMVEGFQGGTTLKKSGVAAAVKSFPGAGPQKNGIDSRSAMSTHRLAYGTTDKLSSHMKPFELAISAGASAIVAAHGIPECPGIEDVPVSYNEYLLKDVLREDLGFDGLVFSDRDALESGTEMGVTAGSRAEKASAMVLAGCDVINGVRLMPEGVEVESDDEIQPEVSDIISAIGALDSDLVDASAKRIIKVMIQLGLFENPYIVDSHNEINGTSARIYTGRGIYGYLAMQQQLVLLKNTKKTGLASLPLDPGVPYERMSTLFYVQDDSESFDFDYENPEVVSYSMGTWNSQVWGNYDDVDGEYSNLQTTEGDGLTKFEGEQLEDAQKLFSNVILHFVDAPESAEDEASSGTAGILSYYYDLDAGVSGGSSAENAAILEKVRYNAELVSGSEDTLYVVLVSMKKPAYVLDEIYDLADAVILHWGTTTEDLLTVLFNDGYKNTSGSLAVGLPSSNQEVEEGDSALPSFYDPERDEPWKARGYVDYMTSLPR